MGLRKGAEDEQPLPANAFARRWEGLSVLLSVSLLFFYVAVASQKVTLPSTPIVGLL